MCRKYHLVIFCFCFTLSNTIVPERKKPKPRPWKSTEACRAEDGLHKCTSENWPTEMCISRLDAMELCGEKLKCMDDEIETKNLCRTRHSVAEKLVHLVIICHPNEFSCELSHKCIPRAWVNDGEDDCNTKDVQDTSDECNLRHVCRNETEFRCHGNLARCIPRSSVMDCADDCGDWSDEDEPLPGCRNDTEFRCHRSNGRCILRRYVNDAIVDCPDAEDENRRDFACVDELEFRCGGSGNFSRCIPREWVGNGQVDCGGGEDERVALSECFAARREFACLDRQRCLPLRYLCDGVQNCRDGSDEIELCRRAPTMLRPRNFGATRTLLPWWKYFAQSKPRRSKNFFVSQRDLVLGFKCYIKHQITYGYDNSPVSHQLRAVPQFYIRNNRSLCSNNEDVCFDTAGRFRCARCIDGAIIPRHQICDGIVDCADLSDECPCEKTKLQKLCDTAYQQQSFNFDVICNGTVDVPGGIDEKFCTNKTLDFTVPLKTQSDRDLTCGNVTEPKYCDGHVDCPLMEDECLSSCLATNIYKRWEKSKTKEPTRNQTNRIVKHCFPFLQNAGEFRFRFDTEFVTPTRESLVTVGNSRTNGTGDTCQYELKLYNSVFEITAENPRCGAHGIYSNLEVMCEIQDVNCTWLYSCVSNEAERIELDKRCDLKLDCSDGSDEVDCRNTTHFYCRSKKPLFIPRSKVGDGKSDCSDRSDECKDTTLSSPYYMIKSRELRWYVWIAAFCILFSNSAVLHKHFRKIRTITSKTSIPFWNTVLLINLSLSDIIFGFTLLVLGTKSSQFCGHYCQIDLEWRSSLTCNAIGILTVISLQTSMNVLVSLTGLRLFTTYRPFFANQLNLKLLLWLVCLSWGSSILLALVPVLSNEYFIESVYLAPNLFFLDHEANRSAVYSYAEKSLHGLSNSTASPVDFDLNSLKSWYFNTEDGRKKYPNRHVEVKGFFGYYSTSSVCFPDLYTRKSPAAAYSTAIMMYNLTCLFFICVAYSLIIRDVASTSGRETTVVEDKENQKMRKRVFFIIVTDMLCWCPIIVMSICSQFGYALPAIAYPISTIVFLPINSFLNPMIYSRLHRSLRKRIAAFFRSICSSNASPPTESMEIKRQDDDAGAPN